MFRIVRASFLVMVVIAVVPLVVDAVLVAPHAVFMDHKTRSGQFTLANPTAQSQEV